MLNGTLLTHCCGCGRQVRAKFVTGKEIYPHRPDLYDKTFLRCPHCGNYVGYKKKDSVVPTIPTPELRKARMSIHSVIDPLWKEAKISRKQIYVRLSRAIGCNYHNSTLSDLSVASKALGEALKIRSEVNRRAK